jgi:DNA-binding MarR family transcriptional regulator
MNRLDAWVAAEEQHAPMMMGFLLNEVREVFAAEDWGGLRQSHFRVLVCVPPEGISVTELAERVGMSKQGCGQFVTQLTGSGHVTVEPDRADRRVRVVRRTAAGRRAAARSTRRNLRVEQEWAARVGPERYEAFRAVLGELARGT